MKNEMIPKYPINLSGKREKLVKEFIARLNRYLKL